MKRIIFILTTVMMMMFGSSLLYSQVQVGEDINMFSNKLPEYHNLAMQSLHATPIIVMMGSSRMDGFKKHPMNASMFCSGFLVDRLGAGLKINYTSIGLSNNLDVELGLSYSVFLTKPDDNKKGGDKVSVALLGNFNLDRINQNDMLVINQNDPSLGNISNYQPGGNISAAIAFLREDKYYIGFTGHQLGKTKSNYMNTLWNNFARRHFLASGGYTFNLAKEKSIDLNLNAIGVTNDWIRFNWEAGIDLKCLQAFSVGIGYKSNNSLKLNASVNAQGWDFGYACDLNLGITKTYKMSNGIFIRKTFNEGRRNKK